ncbi:MAG: MiaB/RimO family radical SAM methylthiotransferase [Tepidisphaerales bacterium]
MRTFSITTLGCKVNQYESEQIAAVLRARGLSLVRDPAAADLRIINTCSVTTDAASKSRQTIRRTTRLPVLAGDAGRVCGNVAKGGAVSPKPPFAARGGPLGERSLPQLPPADASPGQRVIVTGCWATSNKPDAHGFPGVSAVIGHHDDVAAELNHLLDGWTEHGDAAVPAEIVPPVPSLAESTGVPVQMRARPVSPGTTCLPLLADHQTGRQRALLKIQDGCDAHCTYCIIPKLRPTLWSKPVAQAVDEARRLVDAGHHEIVLTGIFLSAYGQSTALRRRQLHQQWDGHSCLSSDGRAGDAPVQWDGHSCLSSDGRAGDAPVQWDRHSCLSSDGRAGDAPVQWDRHSCLSSDGRAGDIPVPPRPSESLACLIEALCTRVPNLKRLRLSSLEPGDLSGDLLAVLRAHPQITPHFHVPLQSGSDAILRRMNRQYTRDDFLRMIDQVRAAFDRPAFTTDIIAGFPGETDAKFEQTLAVVDRARFIHIHAFRFSARPGTAAARWTRDFVHGPIVNTRIASLGTRAAAASLEFRSQFVGQTMTVMVEPGDGSIRHGRSERYFSVHFDGGDMPAGRCVTVRIDRVTPARTHGTLLERPQP